MNQSVLFFSWNSVEVLSNGICVCEYEAPLLGGGICNKYDASLKWDVDIYTPVYNILSPRPSEKVKWQSGIRMCV